MLDLPGCSSRCGQRKLWNIFLTVDIFWWRLQERCDRGIRGEGKHCSSPFSTLFINNLFIIYLKIGYYITKQYKRQNVINIWDDFADKEICSKNSKLYIDIWYISVFFKLDKTPKHTHKCCIGSCSAGRWNIKDYCWIVGKRILSVSAGRQSKRPGIHKNLIT